MLVIMAEEKNFFWGVSCIVTSVHAVPRASHTRIAMFL